MKDHNQSYYIPVRTNLSDAPLFSFDYNPGLDLSRPSPVELKQPISVILSDPEPRKPRMVDYHLLDGSVYSVKIKNVLDGLEILGIQLLPVSVKLNSDQYVEYWYMHIYQRLAGCLDLGISEYETRDGEDTIIYMSKILLDNKKIEEIPLKNRLIFKPVEYQTEEIYHESIVKKIEEVSPEGVKFMPLTEWDDDALFRS